MLVQRIKAQAKTASGIYLPESSVKELNEAKVLAVGPGGLDRDGKRVPVGVQAGDRVLIPTVREIPGVRTRRREKERRTVQGRDKAKSTLWNWRDAFVSSYGTADVRVCSSSAAPPSRLARMSTPCSGTASKSC